MLSKAFFFIFDDFSKFCSAFPSAHSTLKNLQKWQKKEEKPCSACLQPITHGSTSKTRNSGPSTSITNCLHFASSFRNALDNLRNTLLEIGEPRQLVVPCVQCGDNKIIMARQVTKEEVERNPAFAEFLQVSRSNSPNDRRASRVSSRSVWYCYKFLPVTKYSTIYA